MGNYLRIDSVSAYPSVAQEGDYIAVSIQVTNKSTSDVYACVDGIYNGIGIPKGAEFLVGAGLTRMFYRSFYMPDENVQGTMRVWLFQGGSYILEESKDFEVFLQGQEPVLGEKAAIMTLKANGSSAPISLGFASTFDISFLGKNYSTQTICLEAEVVIKNPHGMTVYNKSDAESYPYTGPNGTHQFIFPMNSPIVEPHILADVDGQWTVSIWLRDHGTGELLDRWLDEPIVNVEEEAVTYSAEILAPQIRERNGSYVSLLSTPAIGQNKSLQVKFDAKNTGTHAVNMKGSLRIVRPSGSVLHEISWTQLLTVNPGQSYTYELPPDGTLGITNEVGTYHVYLTVNAVYGQYDEEVAYENYTFTVAEGSGNGGTSEFEGHIGTVYCDQTGLAGGELPVPVAGIVGKGVRISFHGHNDDPLFSHYLCAHLWVYGPSEILKYYSADCSNTMILPSSYHPFVFPSAISNEWIDVDEAGQWTYKARLEDEHGGLLELREGILFTSAAAEPESEWGAIMSIMMVMMMMTMMVSMGKEMSAGLEEEQQ